MKKSLLISLTLCFFLPLAAQETNDHAADSLRHVFGRQQVVPTTLTTSEYADTLDTGNPSVKVVLYDNGTYRFVKDPSAVADSTVFSEFWDTRTVNPYNTSP